MIQSSSAYKELTKTNTRPKTDIEIIVSGTDSSGQEIKIVYGSNNIQTASFKRGIDPFGRELPYLELTWTEIYTGKLNSQIYPEKFNNMLKYMTVDLIFTQHLNFYGTWKDIASRNITWAELLYEEKTWKTVKKNSIQEKFNMPKMFLTAKPTISGQTVTWVAKDVLSFLDTKSTGIFNTVDIGETLYFEKLADILYSEALGTFANVEPCKQILLKSAENIENMSEYESETLKHKIIFEDMARKDVFLQYCNIKNYVVTFDNDGSIKLLDFRLQNNSIEFCKNTMFDNPSVQLCTNISSYNFTINPVQYSEDEKYTVVADSKENEMCTFYYKKYGNAFYEDNPEHESIFNWLCYATSFNSTDLTVTPISVNHINKSISSELEGEVYSENNSLNPFDENSTEIQERFDNLKSYFSEELFTFEFEGLPDFSIEPYDGCEIETNLYDGDEEIVRTGVVVKSEITYNGSCKQKFTIHDATHMPKG